MPNQHVRNVALDIVFTLLTCGLFNFYVQYKQCDAVNDMIQEDKYNFIHWFLFCLITCGLYHIYHEYRKSSDIARILGKDDILSFVEEAQQKVDQKKAKKIAKKLKKGKTFDFEEDTSGPDSSKYAWTNAAYSMAVNINRSFKEYGWCSRIRGIESGGDVQGLPVHTFPSDDGGVDIPVLQHGADNGCCGGLGVSAGNGHRPF